MPADFIVYVFVACTMLVGSGAVVVAAFAWAARKVKGTQRWRGREARRDGYPSDGDDRELAEGLDRLIVEGRIDDVFGYRDRRQQS
jgi:hypothetical protein